MNTRQAAADFIGVLAVALVFLKEKVVLAELIADRLQLGGDVAVFALDLDQFIRSELNFLQESVDHFHAVDDITSNCRRAILVGSSPFSRELDKPRDILISTVSFAAMWWWTRGKDAFPVNNGKAFFLPRGEHNYRKEASMKTNRRGNGRGVAGALLTLLLGTAVYAEGPAISGFVDTQYIYNFDNPLSGMTPLRSYDAQDNNISNTAHLAMTGKVGEAASYTVELDAGSDADVTVADSAGASVVLQEAYLVYAPGKLGFKAGKFATYQGIEVIESIANPTISRGFLYGLAEPFTHVGAVATLALEKIDFAFGLVNGWDQVRDVNDEKTWVGKAGFNFGDPLTFTISGYHGAEQADVVGVPAATDDPFTPIDESIEILGDSKAGDKRTSVDFTGVTKIIPKVDLWFQANWGYEDNVSGTTDDNWGGFAVEPVINVTEKFFIGARYEYFANSNGSRVGGTDDFSAYNLTLAPGYKLADGVVVRAEVRQDTSNKQVFTDDKGMPDDSNTTGSVQLSLAF